MVLADDRVWHWQRRECGPEKGEGVVLVLEKGAPCRCEDVVLADERV